MAKIKLKFGQNEIEVDSRDFYVDNQTIGEVIENLASILEENKTNPSYENTQTNPSYENTQTNPSYENTQTNPSYENTQTNPSYENTQTNPSYENTQTNPSYENTPALKDSNFNGLNSLEDIEIFEPEFNEPKPILSGEIKDKLQILEKNTFFNVPRTVTDTVQQLREYGWVASPLDVSKALVNMALNREILKNSIEHRTQYFVQETFLTN